MPVAGGSAARHPLRVHVERIDRGAGGHEQAIAVDAAEAHVGAALGQVDAPDELLFAAEDVDAVERLAAHAPAHPQVAVDVQAEAVRRPAGLGGKKHAAVREPRAAVHDVVDAHHARGHAGLDDVEPGLVGREGEAVGPVDVARRHGELARPRIPAVDAGRQLRLGDVSFVVAEDAERRIGEPDRAVRLAHDVVRRVKRLAVVALGDHADGAVVLGARHAPRVVLAGEQPPLAVARIAVGVVRGLAEHADRAGFLLPLHDAVVRDVAPQKIASVAEPHRALAPAHARSNSFDLRQREAVAREARVDDLDGRIRIALARLPRSRSLCYGAGHRRQRGNASPCLEKRSFAVLHDALPLLFFQFSRSSDTRMLHPPSLAGQRGGYEKPRYGITQCGCARAFGLDGGHRAHAGQGKHQGTRGNRQGAGIRGDVRARRGKPEPAAAAQRRVHHQERGQDQAPALRRGGEVAVPGMKALKALPLLSLLCALSLAFSALAQGYPVKPVRVVVPFAPGGGTDVQARVLFRELSEQFRQPFIVDNRPGASGLIGAEAVVNAPADGYTILFTTATLASHATLYKGTIKFDPVKDTAPVMRVSSTPLVLIVHPGVAGRSLEELIDLLKKSPGRLNAAINVPGSTSHLAAEMFKQLAGLSFTVVPYKGGGLSMAAVMSGEVDFQFAEGLLAAPQVRGGRVRALAVTTPTPLAGFPGLPAMNGILPGLVADNWFAIYAPAGTPRDVVTTINRALKKALDASAVRALFEQESLAAVGSTPEELGAHLRREIDRYAEVIRKGNITPQ